MAADAKGGEGMAKYESVCSILRNRIECGLLPNGARLPSRADLCAEFGTSEKTVRRAVAELAADGLVETGQRRRPVVTFDQEAAGRGLLPLRRADAAAASGVMKSGILLCYPVIRAGLERCGPDDWGAPLAVIAEMDPGRPVPFWRLSNRFWRFFACRLENDLAVRAVDSLGFAEFDPRPGTLGQREAYRRSLEALVGAVRRGEMPERSAFDDLSALYGTVSDEDASRLRASSDSPLRAGAAGPGARMGADEERYARVCLDILGAVSTGRYRAGDRLPSHAELQEAYGVSVDTTAKAVRLLQEWGVVRAVRGRGIFVTDSAPTSERVPVDPVWIAWHVRRMMDALELLELTAEGVAAHAASRASADDVRSLRAALEADWEGEERCQMAPALVLDFIVGLIGYDALREIYRVVRDGVGVGRIVPKLIGAHRTAAAGELDLRCRRALEALEACDEGLFACEAAGLFAFLRAQIVGECDRLGYGEPARRAYDGSLLWR